MGATPNPSGTIAYIVDQNVTDEGPAPFNGATPYDLHGVETDAGTNQSIVVTTDTYYAPQPYGATQTGFYTFGYTSSDTLGQKIDVAYSGVPSAGGASNGLVDILPETQAQTWTNTGAQSLTESESDGFSANRTTNANGSYDETDTYPQASQFTPPPAPQTATLSQNANGSGTYSFPLFGATPNVTFSYAAPSGGSIVITTPSKDYTVAAWYSLPLYAEHDAQLGELTIPAGCRVPANLATMANGVEQTYTRVDTILGTVEKYDEVSYIFGGYAVCVTMSDVTNVFYDYSGQGNGAPYGISFGGGQTPLEIISLASTVGLTSTNVSGAAAHRSMLAASSSEGFAFARQNFRIALERKRLERRNRAFQALRVRLRARLVR
jgi:hypothetical protein